MRSVIFFVWLAAALVAVDPALPARAALPTLTGGESSLAPMLRSVTGAVVNISVVSRAPQEDNPLLADPFFRRFFGVPDQPRAQQSAGSGVIVDAERGYVLTNHHVIESATEVKVTLKDRRELAARLIGSDPATDIAVLEVEAAALTALRIGDSDALEVGDFVVAIGNPFGLGQTVTSGIVSALGRTGLNIENYEDFIQTDAAINPGNSGGALVNLRGELVGINTAILGPSGGNVGIGFAVPVAIARAVMEQIIRYGEVRRGFVGILSQDLTPALAASLKTTTTEGALIADVVPKSPAQRAGLRKGDVVVAADGRPIRTSSALRNRMGLTPIGQEVRLGVLRDGARRDFLVVIEDVRKFRLANSEPIPELPGARFAPLPSDAGVKGVYVVDVEPKSQAHQAGLREGDAVIGVNGRRIESVRELGERVRAVNGSLTLHLIRGESRVDLRMRRRAT